MGKVFVKTVLYNCNPGYRARAEKHQHQENIFLIPAQ